ncbi:MAG TPA: MFS transporter [Steroidobacteraceae bacterium]|nr:MFS transporter [Steroidobacteraceae bacterium]
MSAVSEPRAAAAPGAGAGAGNAGRPRLRDVLVSHKMLAILLLAAASGFPNQITESALQAWLKDTGATNTTIGIMSYVALPYLLKFLWAPLVDRFPVPFLGRRRGWILAMQLGLAAAIAVLALQDPAASLRAVTLCAVAIVMFSATQDIAIDAYRTDVSLPSERGLAAAAANLGYRTASYLALAVGLIVADHFGWRPAFLILAAAMLLFCVATVSAPSSHNQYQPRSLSESVIEPLRELLGTPSALTLIAVILLFKIGDAFANKLFTPFMMDVGFSKTEIGLVIKALFTLSSLGGSVLGGLLMVRLGLVRAMLSFGVLQALSNLLYCALAIAGKSYSIMFAAVIIEHVAAAMGSIALVALIMALCDPRYSAFQYALLSALALLPRYTLGFPAGWVADHQGWFAYYVVSFALALPGLAMVWSRRRQIAALDERRS